MKTDFNQCFFPLAIFGEVRPLIPSLFLCFLAFSCADEATSDPLEKARDRLLSASSVSFEMDNIWNNTFLNDTMIEHHQGTYLRREQEGFPYDFTYVMEDFATVTATQPSSPLMPTGW